MARFRLGHWHQLISFPPPFDIASRLSASAVGGAQALGLAAVALVAEAGGAARRRWHDRHGRVRRRHAITMRKVMVDDPHRHAGITPPTGHATPERQRCQVRNFSLTRSKAQSCKSAESPMATVDDEILHLAGLPARVLLSGHGAPTSSLVQRRSLGINAAEPCSNRDLAVAMSIGRTGADRQQHYIYCSIDEGRPLAPNGFLGCSLPRR